MANIKKEYERWLANATADTDVAAELKTLDDAKKNRGRILSRPCLWYGRSPRCNRRWHQSHERLHGGKGFSGFGGLWVT